MKRLIFIILLSFNLDFVRADSWTTLDFPGASSTHINGVSGNNLVGDYIDASGGHGFIFNGDTWVSYTVSGAILTSFNGISDSTIIGQYAIKGAGGFIYYHDFIYDGSNLTPFQLPGTINTTISGINESDLIVSANLQNFIYNLATQTTTPIDIPGSPHGIDGDNIVGYYSEHIFPPGQPVMHGFIYNMTTQSWTTLDRPGSNDTRPMGISGSNIVGWGFLYNTTTNVWTPLNAPGAKTTYAQAIDGDNIVGYYSDATGTHGFLYTIPEPATLMLLGIGAVFIRKSDGTV